MPRKSHDFFSKAWMKELLSDFGDVEIERPDPYREATQRHLAMLQVNLEMRQNKSSDLREVIMNLAPAYEEWYTKTKQEGITEGKQLGITEGKQVQSIQTARRMLNKNMSLEEIAELTDLPLAQIQALQAENR